MNVDMTNVTLSLPSSPSSSETASGQVGYVSMSDGAGVAAGRRSGSGRAAGATRASSKGFHSRT